MSPSRLVDVLGEVFQTYGFDTCVDSEPEGRSGATYRADLMATRHGVDAFVQLHAAHAPLSQDHVDAHAVMVKDIGATYGIFVNLGGFDEGAHDAAARHHTILWDQDALERLIGRAVLHEILGDDDEPPIASVLGISAHARPADHASTPTARRHADTYAMPHETMDTIAHPIVANAEPATPFLLLDGALDGAQYDPIHADGPVPTPAAPTGLAGLIHDALAPSTAPQPFEAVEAPDPILQHEAAMAVTRPAADDHITHGQGWVLETSRRIAPTPVDDPDPTPVALAPEAPGPISHLGHHLGLGRRHSGDDPRSFNPPSGALLAPTTDRTQAAATARLKTFTIDHTWLRYHPKRVLRWEVDAFVEGQVTTTTLSGVALVDTATRKIDLVESWTPSRQLREGTFDVPVEHKPERIDADKCREIALRPVLENTSREVTMEDHDAGLDVIITQTKRIRAHPDDLRFTDEGLHWCPVWCFQGVNGSVEIDALNGAILEEQLRSSATETIIL